jgi:hypothetical protein
LLLLLNNTHQFQLDIIRQALKNITLLLRLLLLDGVASNSTSSSWALLGRPKHYSQLLNNIFWPVDKAKS